MPSPIPVSSPVRSRIGLAIGAVAALVLLAVCLGLAFASTLLPRSASIISTSTPPISSALPAVVHVLVPIDQKPDYYSAGSGSIITHHGHILTNLHVLRDMDTGQAYNTHGDIYIGITTDPNAPAKVMYHAQLATFDETLDLAVLQIDSRDDGAPLSPNLNLRVLSIGNSGRLGVGDQLSLLGYPGLGGDTITLTRGSVSGFLPDEGWIKTDAEISPGNSGGAAINGNGELVGVPSAGVAPVEPQSLPSKLGLIRPINLAHALIDWAQRAAGE